MMAVTQAPPVYHNDGSDSSTTKSAVEGGTLIVRNTDKQQQNVNDLSRDTENANNPLGQIFNKQKEQDKIDKIGLVADIAAQAKDVANKYASIRAEGQYNALPETEKAKKSKEDYIKQALKEGGMGNMGDAFSKGIDAASSIVVGIIKGDITGGLAGASAPYLAGVIKDKTGDDYVANKVAHAILGGTVAAIQGNSALAGAGGAAGGELIADIIRKELYGKEVKDLTESEKQNLSNLTQLALGLATAASGGSTSDVGTAMAGGKNAVENNYLCVETTCKLRPGEMIMTGGGAPVVGELVVGGAILAEETGALDGAKDSFNQWLTTGRDGVLIKSDDGSSNDEPEINNPVTGSGSIAVGGTPGLPPDDDDDNSNRDKNNNNQNNTSKDPNEIKHTYNSIKDSPNYPKGFKDVQNGTVNNTVKDKPLLEQLRKIEPGRWTKVYKDGYDAAGNKVSIHYFRSQSGRVFNVKVKTGGWSNL